MPAESDKVGSKQQFFATFWQQHSMNLLEFAAISKKKNTKISQHLQSRSLNEEISVIFSHQVTALQLSKVEFRALLVNIYWFSINSIIIFNYFALLYCTQRFDSYVAKTSCAQKWFPCYYKLQSQCYCSVEQFEGNLKVQNLLIKVEFSRAYFINVPGKN